jgi:hypothetical protein
MISLLQSNGRLDGVFGNQHWKVQGTVVGDQVTFSFSPPKHPEITVRYQGTLDSSDRMHGTMASEVQSGTFVATRKWRWNGLGCGGGPSLRWSALLHS